MNIGLKYKINIHRKIEQMINSFSIPSVNGHYPLSICFASNFYAVFPKDISAGGTTTASLSIVSPSDLILGFK